MNSVNIAHIAESVRFSSDFPMDAFMSICRNATFWGSDGENTFLNVEDGNYRAFLSVSYQNKYEIINDFVIFEIRNGGEVWQLRSFCIDEDEQYSSFVIDRIRRTKKVKKLQSGLMTPSEKNLWDELRNGGMSMMLYDAISGFMTFPQNTDMNSPPNYRIITHPMDQFTRTKMNYDGVMSELIRVTDSIWYNGKLHNRVGNE